MSPLIVSAPPANTARLRFVTTANDFGAELIRFDTRGAVSHVEAVMADGSIIGSYANIGVTRQPNNFDCTSTMQIFVDLKMPEPTYKVWSEFLADRIGWPYDARF